MIGRPTIGFINRDFFLICIAHSQSRDFLFTWKLSRSIPYIMSGVLGNSAKNSSFKWEIACLWHVVCSSYRTSDRNRIFFWKKDICKLCTYLSSVYYSGRYLNRFIFYWRKNKRFCSNFLMEKKGLLHILLSIKSYFHLISFLNWTHEQTVSKSLIIIATPFRKRIILWCRDLKSKHW